MGRFNGDWKDLTKKMVLADLWHTPTRLKRAIEIKVRTYRN